MAKKPKDTQTDYTRQGKQIADAAVPYYQSNLGRMESYLQDPSARIDEYIDKYYTNTAAQDTFLRNYKRTMGGTTAQNYMATGGGYDTSNQRNYDDIQRYQNDLAAKLRDYGVQGGEKLAQQDYANMLLGNEAYRSAYALGEPYSNIERYNNQVKQYNKFGNQIMGLVGGAGRILSAIPTPVTQGIGAGMQTIGNTFGMEGTAGLSPNYYTDIAKGIAQTSQYGGDNWVNTLVGGHDISGNEALRASGTPTTQGQYANPQQITADFLNKNQRLNPTQDGELTRRLRERGLII